MIYGIYSVWQVCYGMIYGIGPRALGEQLGVDENDAAAFIETFKSKYPGIILFISWVWIE